MLIIYLFVGGLSKILMMGCVFVWFVRYRLGLFVYVFLCEGGRFLLGVVIYDYRCGDV